MHPVTRRFFGMLTVAAVGCILSGALVRGEDTPPTPPPAPTGTATITGTVTANGAPVAGATVNLLPPRKTDGPATQPASPTAAPTDPGQGSGKGHRPKPIATTTTAADGTYTFSNVAAGNYSVAATLKGTGNGRGQATVADGATVTVNITLAKRTPKNPPPAN